MGGRSPAGKWVPKWSRQHEKVLNEAVWSAWSRIRAAFAADDTEINPEAVKWSSEVPRIFYAAFKRTYDTDAGIGPQQIYQKFLDLKGSRRSLPFDVDDAPADDVPTTTRTHRSKAMYVYVGVLFKSLTDDSDLRSLEERAISALAGLDGGFRVKCTRGSLTFHILSSVTTLPFDVGNRVANVLAELTQDAADEITVLAGSAASLTNSVAPDRVKVVIRELLTGWGDDAKNGV